MLAGGCNKSLNGQNIDMVSEVRIDKWLWAVRLYKTRSVAQKACNGNRVRVNGTPVKPAYRVEIGDIVDARRGHITYRYKVLKLIENRRPASEIPKYAKDITPKDEVEKMNVPRETLFVQRDRGAGRPTKRDRRQMEDMMEQLTESLEEGWDIDFDE